MKPASRFALSLVLAFTLTVALAGCTNASLVGDWWSSSDGTVLKVDKEWFTYADGTQSRYSITGDTVLEVTRGDQKNVFRFAIDGNTLTLTGESGDSTSRIRVGSSEYATAKAKRDKELLVAASFRTGSDGVLAEYKGSDGIVVIPATVSGVKVTTIGKWAFNENVKLTSVTIPEGVTSIEDGNTQDRKGNGSSAPSGAFALCTGLANVNIPQTLTSIGDLAFLECSGLTTAPIPPSVKRIGASAFLGCKGLTSVTIPEGVTALENYTFAGCTGLTSVTIPDGVTEIGDGAFYVCTGLTSVTVPDSVTSIGAVAFEGCSQLTVRVPKGAAARTDAFKGCLKVEYY